MSEDREDVAKRLQQYFVPKTEYDADKRNYEDRFNNLRKDVNGHETRLGAVERRHEVLENEHRVAKNERIALLQVVLDMQSFMRTASPRIMRRVTWVGGIACVLLAALLLKDLILPLLSK